MPRNGERQGGTVWGGGRGAGSQSRRYCCDVPRSPPGGQDLSKPNLESGVEAFSKTSGWLVVGRRGGRGKRAIGRARLYMIRNLVLPRGAGTLTYFVTYFVTHHVTQPPLAQSWRALKPHTPLCKPTESLYILESTYICRTEILEK